MVWKDLDWCQAGVAGWWYSSYNATRPEVNWRRERSTGTESARLRALGFNLSPRVAIDDEDDGRLSLIMRGDLFIGGC